MSEVKSKFTIKKMRRFIWLMAWWPPYLGTGLKVRAVNETATRYEIDLKLRFYNSNIYGTHFGGSLYSMCDPWFAFAVSAYLGSEDYIIWDKSASIDYIKPGKGKVTAIFEIEDSRLAEIKAEVDNLGRQSFTFETNITGKNGEIVANVVKEVYVRLKAKSS